MQLLGVLLILVGLGPFAGALYYRHRARRSCRWVPVQGRVLTTSSTYEEFDEWTAYHVPSIRYAYEVDGRTYEGRVVRPLLQRRFRRDEDLKTWRAKHSDGGALTVFVNPRDPAESALETQVPMYLFWVLMLFAAVFLIAGSVIFAVFHYLNALPS